MGVIQHLHRQREEHTRLLPDPARSIRDHAQAHVRLRDQASRLDLLERVSRLFVRLPLRPARHLDDPVIGEQVAPEPLGFPPLARPPCTLGSDLLAARPSAFGCWRPGRQVVLVVDGGYAAVSLALACVKHQVTMVSRLRWDAALYHPPGPQLPCKRGPKPTKGKCHRSLQGWAERADTPWETVQVRRYGGQRKTLWVFSRTPLWYTPRQPPVAICYVLVADPEGKLRMEAFCCTDLQATPVQILAWVVMRWAVEVTFEESRAHLGLDTQRPWSDQAIARTTLVPLALFSVVTVMALKLSQTG